MLGCLIRQANQLNKNNKELGHLLAGGCLSVEMDGFTTAPPTMNTLTTSL